MERDSDMAERHGRVLAELTELCLSSARDLHAAQLATDDPAAKSDLGAAFHSVARSVRQTLALEARLERERERQGREAQKAAARVAAGAVHTRQIRVRQAVDRLIENEAEGEEADRLTSDLDDILDEEALCADFLAEAVEAHVARIGRMLGLTPPSLSPPEEGDRAQHGGERSLGDSAEGAGPLHGVLQSPSSDGEGAEADDFRPDGPDWRPSG